jgi:hypothetical protein
MVILFTKMTKFGNYFQTTFGFETSPILATSKKVRLGLQHFLNFNLGFKFSAVDA